MQDGTVFGTLCAIDFEHYEFKEHEVSIIKTMGQMIGHTIDLENMAIRDALTGLYNRVFVKGYMDLSQENAIESFTALFIDLDNFKLVNDTFGHNEGDLIVMEIAERIKRLFGQEEIIARWGGDEFIVLLSQYTFEDRIEIEELVNELLNMISEPIMIEGIEVKMTASIGISFHPENGHDMNELLKQADITMYTAKDKGKNNFQFYQKQMESYPKNRFKIENALRNALEKDEFDIHYQPIFHLETQKLFCFEALIRWNHPEGQISPINFIPIAEETGLIHPIGDWVIQRVCEDGKRWKESGMRIPDFSINLAVNQFDENDFVERVDEIIRKSEFNPQNLIFEITESMLMKDIHYVKNKLNQLKMLGIRFAIDDFGSGYSSLAYLSELPILYLKLDKAFTLNLHKDNKNVLMAKAIINLAHSLGILSVAEGIETEQQLQFLLNHSSDYGQGYLLGKPMDVQKALQFTSDRLCNI
ncbi:MAG: EAL domain-containing protein [Bacillota bacterium]|nr:EAL domain-containing protein [Bacillota bacterium]